MDDDEKKIAGMILDLVTAVRRSKRTSPGLARAALDWEVEIAKRLNVSELLVAEESTPPPTEERK